MPRHAGLDISVEEVERQLAPGIRRLQFSPPIEAAFVRFSMPERKRVIIGTAIAAIILYDLFLVTDWFTLHDMFAAMIVARLGIFTPAIFVVIAVVRRARTVVAVEMTSTFGACLAILLPMTVLVFSASPDKLSYQYGSVLVMLFTTAVQQIRFRYAVAALAVMLSIQLVAIYVSHAFSSDTYVSVCMFFVTLAILLAITTYLLERAERRSYLLGLRAELLRAEIERGARTDPLTSLFNRRYLAESTATLWAEAKAAPLAVSAILLDIDHFKLFNDSQGHLQGDACLRAVSTCVAAVAAEHDALAFRFGGEEILLLLPGIEITEATVIAEEVRAAIEAAALPHPAAGTVVTASLGVAAAVAPETTINELIKVADHGLYAAKRAGRNRVCPPVASLTPPMATKDAEAA